MAQRFWDALSLQVCKGKDASDVPTPLKPKEPLFSIPRIPFRIMLHPSALVVMSSHSIYNFGRYFLYFWMPTCEKQYQKYCPHRAIPSRTARSPDG